MASPRCGSRAKSSRRWMSSTWTWWASRARHSTDSVMRVAVSVMPVGCHSHPSHVGEARVVLEERQLGEPRRTVPVLRQDDLRRSPIRRVRVVHLVAIYEENDVRVLLQTAGLSQVSE